MERVKILNKNVKPLKKHNALKNSFRNNYEFYLMLIPAVLFYVIFRYAPMYGILIAFKDYNFMTGVMKSPWVGLDVFKEVVRDSTFWRALMNTLRLNFLSLFISFPIPIIFALLLNEIKSNKFKRIIQSISYLPHFISWVILYGLILTLTTKDSGLINAFLKSIGQEQINFLGDKGWWLFTYIFSGVWKEVGWSAIIYLSALSAIDPALYEAAAIDGAGRFKSMIHVTLPGIKGTIIIILILNIGRMMSIGFDQPYLLGNALVSDISKVLSTYVFEMGLERAQYSFTTAVGLFQSVVNFILLLGADYLAKLLGEDGIFGGEEN
jgi:putative aldouronate transport system permease protein